MARPRIIPATSYRRMPWKNGGGETIEIAAHPEASTLETFNWRVSMARVDGPGPFSIFPGIDRTLTVLEGEGLTLRIDGREAVTLTRDSAPLAFPADVPVDAATVGGAILDLNVMSRRGRVAHRVRRTRAGTALVLDPEADATMILVRGGDLTLADGAGRDLVRAGDAVLFGRRDGTLEVLPAGSTVPNLYVIEFRSQ
jgi:environmental stress-induced protein Ves